MLSAKGQFMPVSRHIRRLVATALAAGAVVTASALPAGAHDGNGRHDRDRYGVVVGGVQHSTPGRDARSNRSLNAEWVEVHNTGRHSVDLRGWTLTDSDGNRYRFRNVRLDGRSSVRVHTGHGRDTRHDVYQDRGYQVWDRRDTATLRDDRGRVVDEDSWGRDRGFDGDRRDRDRDHDRDRGFDGDRDRGDRRR